MARNHITCRRAFRAALVGSVFCLNVSIAQALPIFIPTWDTSATGVVLLDSHGQSLPGRDSVQILPVGVDSTFSPAFRQYFNPDPCSIARAGSAMGCPFLDALADPAVQNWELEIYNASPAPVTFNYVDFTTGSGGASYIVGLGGAPGLGFQATLHIDLTVNDTFFETGTKAAWLVSDPTFPLGFTFSVAEGGTATATTPVGAPCPVITPLPCFFAIYNDPPTDFFIAGFDPALPTVWFNRPSDRDLFPFAVPEPGTVLLLLSALTGHVVRRARQRRATARD